MRLLVTDGADFIGSHIVEHFSDSAQVCQPRDFIYVKDIVAANLLYSVPKSLVRGSE